MVASRNVLPKSYSTLSNVSLGEGGSAMSFYNCGASSNLLPLRPECFSEIVGSLAMCHYRFEAQKCLYNRRASIIYRGASNAFPKSWGFLAISHCEWGPWNSVSKVLAPINIIPKEAEPLEMHYAVGAPSMCLQKYGPPKMWDPLNVFSQNGDFKQ